MKILKIGSIVIISLLSFCCSKQEKKITTEVHVNLTNYISSLTNNFPKIVVPTHIDGLYQTSNNTNYFILHLTSYDQLYSVRLIIDYASLHIRGFLNEDDQYFYFYQNPHFGIITNIMEQKKASPLGYSGDYRSLGGIPKILSINLLDQDIKSLHEYNASTDIRENLARIIVSIVEAMRFKNFSKNFDDTFRESGRIYNLGNEEIYYIHHWSMLSRKVLYEYDTNIAQVLSIAKTKYNLLNNKK